MITGINNRLTGILGQQVVQPFDFIAAALTSLIGVLFVIVQIQVKVAEISTWTSIAMLLSFSLFALSFLSHSVFSKSFHRNHVIINIVSTLLLAACGLLWGSLYSVLQLNASEPTGHAGFWLSMLITAAVAVIFRQTRFIRWIWILMVMVPSLLLFLQGQLSQELIQVPVVILAISFVSAFFASKKQPEYPQPEIEPENMQVLEDLKIAFAAQDAAIQAETALRQAVEKSLRQANRIAEAANYSKTEFMATIGHEIRTPLNGILPTLEMLEATNLSQEQKQLVHTAAHSSRHLLRIINDVLDFSKAEVGRLELESIELDLHEVVYSVTDLMKQAAANKGLQLKVSISSGVPQFVRGDALRLKQVITNLLSNALKFTDRGEISLEVSLQHEHIREVELLFSVKDTGIGMSENTRSKLFRSFTQADASTTRVHGGTGLGLAICKRLVELMGGDIDVQSTEGRGSNFWFVIPMRKSLKVIPALRQDFKDVRILFYTKNLDEPEALKLVKDEVKVDVVHEIEQAVELISRTANRDKRNFYDLLIIDVVGHEVTVTSDLLLLKKHILKTMTQIMIINALPLQIQELKAAGADSVLVRPHRAEILRQNLFRLLDIGLTKPLAETHRDHQLSLSEKAVLESQMPLSLLNESTEPSATALFSGNVLLVEDNPVNLSVAKRMLQLQGLDVDVATDGYEAFEKMKQGAYDLVFMDCLMPVMDGFEATRHWREHEQHEKPDRHLVIIAMTANAMRGDREKCMSANMDDYLPKPLTKTQLTQMLAKWLPEDLVFNEVSEPANQEIEVGPEKHSDLLDESVLLELHEVMGEDYQSVIHSYLLNASQLLTDLKHKANENDIEAVIRAVHSFKSSSKNVGAIDLGEKAEALEEQLRNKAEVDIPRAVQELVVSYDEVAKALKEYL